MAKYAKFVTALIGFVLVLLTSGVLPAEATPWVNAVIAAATALGVYAVPNAPTAPTDGD